MSKRLRISEFNKGIRAIKSSEYNLQVVTLRNSIQQTYPNLIIERGLRAGELRTFKEYTTQLLKVLPPEMRKNELLPKYEQYKQLVERMIENVRDRNTLTRELRYQNQRMNKIISKYVPDIDPKKLTFQQKREAFRIAQELEYSKGYIKSLESGKRWAEDLKYSLLEVLQNGYKETN